MKLIPVWAQAAIVAAAVAVLFGAGWTVRGWKDGKTIEKLRGNVTSGERVAAEYKASMEGCAGELSDVRMDLKLKAAERAELDRLYQEAVNREPETVIEYRDRWHDAEDVIVAADCPEAVGQLVGYLHTLPGVEPGAGGAP